MMLCKCHTEYKLKFRPKPLLYLAERTLMLKVGRLVGGEREKGRERERERMRERERERERETALKLDQLVFELD